MNYNYFIAITNRHLCKKTDYLQQIRYIAQLHPKAIVLREKDLSLEEYISLAKNVLQICKKEDTTLILHNYIEAAYVLQHPYIHLPISILSNILSKENIILTADTKQNNSQSNIKTNKTSSSLSSITMLGTSVHSIEQALLAKQFGCNYIFAGNIYETNCKPGLAGKGLNFLKEIVQTAHMPVYAIGGISLDNINEVLSTGATGGCMMSGFMEH